MEQTTEMQHEEEQHQNHAEHSKHTATKDANRSNAAASPAALSSGASAATSSFALHLKNWLAQTKSFFKECSRVLKITKKPTSQEFWTTVKVTGIGILLIGLIGFLISTIQLILKNLVFG